MGQRPESLNHQQEHAHAATVCPLSGDSPIALRAARTACTILITGETGVGKGQLARWLHDHSPRAQRPFVPVNCAAIPDTIIDSQLFGHARGSFTGATQDHLGLIRAAHGGTLFLDEVVELPLSAQSRLLRLLQEREIQPVGHSRPLVVDVRVIAATNMDPQEAVATRRFRSDLLFRLDVIRLHVPPLRERMDELQSLIQSFNHEFATLYAQPQLVIHDDAMAVLRGCNWPGNIRQLRTVIERLHVLCPGEAIHASHIREFGQLEPSGNLNSVSLDNLKVGQVRRVLAETGGSIAHAAAIFGVHRSTLYRWLKNHS